MLPLNHCYSSLFVNIYFNIFLEDSAVHILNNRDKGRFPFRKKTRKFRWEQKWNFQLVKSCSILVLNPGTSWCLTVDLELVQTTRNVNGTQHSVRKFQLGKRAHLFRFPTFSGNFPVGQADETCSIYRRTRNSGNFD